MESSDDLTQFHFHTASEHRVLGRGYDMEMHLVHKSADGRNAVVGVFLSRAPSSGALAPIFGALPDEVGPKFPLAFTFNPETYLPQSRKHLRYIGLLTTPPCTEGVQWVVMTEPVDRLRRGHRAVRLAHPLQRAICAARRRGGSVTVRRLAVHSHPAGPTA